MSGLADALRKVGEFEKLFQKADKRMDRIEKSIEHIRRDIAEIKKKLK